VAAVWSSDVTQKTIQNCFHKSGFEKHNFYDEEDNIPLAEIRTRMTNQTEAGEEAYEENLNLKKKTLKMFKVT
jgi:hypothetical protein